MSREEVDKILDQILSESPTSESLPKAVAYVRDMMDGKEGPAVPPEVALVILKRACEHALEDREKRKKMN